jgi:hypothetical protein
MSRALTILGQMTASHLRQTPSVGERLLWACAPFVATLVIWWNDHHLPGLPSGWARIAFGLYLVLLGSLVTAVALEQILIAVARERLGRTLDALRATGLGPTALLLVFCHGALATVLRSACTLPLAVALISAGGGSWEQLAAGVTTIACTGALLAAIALYWAVTVRGPIAAHLLTGLTIAAPVAAVAVLAAIHDPDADHMAHALIGLSVVWRLTAVLAPGLYTGPLIAPGDLLALAFALLVFLAARRRVALPDETPVPAGARVPTAAPPRPAPAAAVAAAPARRAAPARPFLWFPMPRPGPGAAAFAMRTFHHLHGGWEGFLLQLGLGTVLMFCAPWHGERWDPALMRTIFGWAFVWFAVSVSARMLVLFHEERRDGILDDLRTLPVPMRAIFHAKLRAVARISLPHAALTLLLFAILAASGNLPDYPEHPTPAFPGHPLLSYLYFVMLLPLGWLLCAALSKAPLSVERTPPQFSRPTLRQILLFPVWLVGSCLAVGAVVGLFMLPWILQSWCGPVYADGLVWPVFALTCVEYAVVTRILYRAILADLDHAGG